MNSAPRSHTPRPLAVAIVAVMLTTCAGPRGGAAARPEPAGRRAFPVLDQGALSLEVPPGWGVKVLEVEPGTATSIRLDPPSGGALFIAPVFSPEADGSVLEAAALFTEIARRKALRTNGGAEVPTAIVRGAAGQEIGYWFLAADAAYAPPEPGHERYRNILRGAVAAGRLLVTFSWFDDAVSPARDQVIDLVRGARHEVATARPAAPEPAPAPAEAAGGGPPRFELTQDPGATTVPLAVREPGGDFTVLVDLPGFKLYAPRPSPDGAGHLVLGEHPEDGIVVSVGIGPAGPESKDARACRDRKLARLRQAVPDLSEVRTAEAGETSRLSYALRELRGREIRQEHAHAFLQRAGRCVDVHASKAEPEPGDPAKLERILATARFAATL